MEQAFLEILKQIGEDPGRAGLADTPKRAAKAMEFLTQGYAMDIDEVINNAMFPSDTDEMVIVKNIELYSMCEHHLLPFIGKCHVAYEIANCIVEKTNAAGAAVIIEAQHMCMMMRGVEKQNSVMTTSCMLGAFRNSQSTRAEFLSLLNK